MKTPTIHELARAAKDLIEMLDPSGIARSGYEAGDEKCLHDLLAIVNSVPAEPRLECWFRFAEADWITDNAVLLRRDAYENMRPAADRWIAPDESKKPMRESVRAKLDSMPGERHPFTDQRREIPHRNADPDFPPEFIAVKRTDGVEMLICPDYIRALDLFGARATGGALDPIVLLEGGEIVGVLMPCRARD